MQRSMLLLGALSAGMVAGLVPAKRLRRPARPGLPWSAFQDVVTQTNEFQRNFADLQKKYDPKRQQLKTLGDEIETLTKQLEAQGANLSDAERATEPGPSRKRRSRRSGRPRMRRRTFRKRCRQLFNSTARRLGDVLIDYAKQQGYTLVLDGGEPAAGSVRALFGPPTDISKAIVDAYNLKSGVPAPSAGSPPQPAPAAKPPAAR